MNADQHQAVEQRADGGASGDGDDHGQGVGDAHAVDQQPGRVGSQHIERAVGEVGHPADAEGQIESHGGQGQGDTVDGGVDQGSGNQCVYLRIRSEARFFLRVHQTLGQKVRR
ncbi:hypothetical protein DESC_370078 [Desulfosarcina cetonica]|nr:hypothetical protein DESC_370078 [Desulfosarcina cetonica]